MALNVYFATNRLVKKDGSNPEIGDDFHPNLDELRFGKVAFSGRDLFKKQLDAFMDKGQITLAPEKLDKEDADKSKLGSKAIFDEVRAEMLAKGDAVIMVHGYNYTFREAAARAAQLQQWLAAGGKDMVMLLFTWPSAGAGVGVRTYHDDRKRAETSGLALGRAILKAADFIRNTPRAERCEGRVHLLCHSMGNWALRGAVQAMRTYVGNNIPPLFDEVVLIAADEDDDTLQTGHKIAPILRGCRRTTVYYNHQDLALKASDYAMGNPDRLGRSGPDADAELPNKVAVVNVSPSIIRAAKGANAWQADPSGHQYYRNNPRVRQDLVQVLHGKLDEDFLEEGQRRGNDFGGYWRLT
ncbi:MAG: alpha/beta hydrolase [Kiloniellaceae bacterium]